MRYNVFLSKNTKDMAYVNSLISFFESAGLTVFESEKSLSMISDADYAKSIDEAIENSDNLVLLCSPNETGTGVDGDSRWVYYEWTTFRNEIFSGRKDGNIVTVITDGVTVEQLPIGLRKYESFRFQNIEHSRITSYLSQHDYSSRQREQSTVESVDNRRSVLELQAFDIGHQLSACIFSKMQGKNQAQLHDQLADLMASSKLIPDASVDDLLTCNPDDIADRIKAFNGESVAQVFELGQRCGIVSIFALFAVMGADEVTRQYELQYSQFSKLGTSLGIPSRTINILFEAVSEKDQQRIANYYKVIRRAVAVRDETKATCPYCGGIVADDTEKCPVCHSPLRG